MADKESVRTVLLSAAIALVPPLTAGVWSSYNKSKEIELAHISKNQETDLAAKDQTFKMQMAALDRAIDPHRPAEDRKQVLRFLAAVASDESLRGWAKDELTVVQNELDTYKKEVADYKKQLGEKKEAVERLQKTIAQKGHTALDNVHLREQLKVAQDIEADTDRRYRELLLKESPSTSTTSLFAPHSLSNYLGGNGPAFPYLGADGVVRLSDLSQSVTGLVGVDGRPNTLSFVTPGSVSLTVPPAR